MDLKNFETTSTYAIQAIYLEYWKMIPERFRLNEKAQIQPEEPRKKETPLTYKKVEQTEYKPDPYANYCEMLNAKRYFDITPFYDPQLDFENRLHYKIAGIDYPDREHPWFVITWNFGSGLLNSSLTRRRFQTCADYTPGGEKVTFNFMNVDMDITLAIYSNSLQALMELQENILIGQREKFTCETHTHSILGKFPVSVDTIGSQVSKFTRDKSTLCMLTLNLKVDFPIIGNVRKADGGRIEEIHLELDSTYQPLHEEPSDPTAHEVLSRDVINEET